MKENMNFGFFCYLTQGMLINKNSTYKFCMNAMYPSVHLVFNTNLIILLFLVDMAY